MNKNILTIDNKPEIFTNKLNEKSKVIPLLLTRNTLGHTRHFPPATREWFNSIYTYNNSYIKNIPNADRILSKLIKSYFNLYFKKRILKSKKIALRFKRLSLNKIFVSKAELKHTSSKVIITLYIYNEERRLLIKKIKRLENIIFPAISNLKGIKGFSLKYRVSKNLPLSIQEKFLMLKNSKTFEDANLDLIKRTFDKEIKAIAYYKLLLNLNKNKFYGNFLLKLKPLIQKLYSKEVEFNIVSLKTLYFNSDIFTEAIALKIKNRENKLLRVLKSSLYMVKLPFINRIREKYGKTSNDRIWLNRVKNLNLYSHLSGINNDKDLLNSLLFNLFPTFSENGPNITKDESTLSSKESENKNSNEVETIVLNSLKHKTMGGVRLEAKGRLTRRFTASRSVFKVKWKGSLKNLDSSYKGISSVILRGHQKSNVQYSMINSKTRNGSFGLKGWISNK